MYWVRSGYLLEALPLMPLSLMWLVGGWLLATHAFRLEPRERMPVGIVCGLCGYLFGANLVARWLPPAIAYWAAAFLVLAAGLLAAVRGSRPVLDLRDLRPGALAGLALLAWLITLVGRGLGVFDDPRNVSLISLMAAGDIPPHFFMDSSQLFGYHYAFQLFGASLMRVGGLFPWSAYDLSKGIVGALAVFLCGLLGWRLTHSRLGGYGLAFLATFACGDRWLLLLLPPSILQGVSDGVEMWGSAAATGDSLAEGLASGWVIGAGPPFPIPFAFVSGVFHPLVLVMQSGPGALSLAILCAVLLVTRRLNGWKGTAMLSVLMAVWVLAWEVVFGLFAMGMLGVAIASRADKTGSSWRAQLRLTLAATFLAAMIGAVQGGTVTEVARSLLSGSSSAGEGGLGTADFSLRWPPVLISAHLGELSLSDPGDVLVILAEAGVAVLAAPIVTLRAVRWIRSGKFTLGALAIASLIGFVLPMFLTYRVTRDMSRFPGFALMSWVILAFPIVWTTWRSRRGDWLRVVSVGWVATATLGGIVVSGSLLTAMTRVVLTEKMAPVDARVSARYWDRLDPDGEVLDSIPWRAVTLTGRPTRAASQDYVTLAEWTRATENPEASAISALGYDYVYVDSEWWTGMSPEERASFQDPCVQLVDEFHDNGWNGDRWLFDVRGCEKGP